MAMRMLFGFLLAFVPFFWFNFNFLENMPGDIGDPRLNNYSLEHIYQYFIGNVPSLVTLQSFYPYPNTLGFGENFFGSFPIYGLLRIFIPESDTAYQIWFLIGYLFNYLAAYFALRWLKASPVASIVGALIFTFALPVSGQLAHTQLQYRFGIPLAISAFVLFLSTQNIRYFVIGLGWFTWQFFCSMYLGFFLSLYLAALGVVFLFYIYIKNRGKFWNTIKIMIQKFAHNWMYLPKSSKTLLSSITIFFVIGLSILFSIYLKSTLLYDSHRSIYAVSSMLPRWQSYLFSDISKFWPSDLSIFNALPAVRPEHQLFIGAIPMLLLAIGIYVGWKKNYSLQFYLLGSSLLFLFILSLAFFYGYFSFWYLIVKLPIVNSIRAVTRIILIFLFPIAYICTLGIDYYLHRFKKFSSVALSFLIPIMAIEFTALNLNTSTKSDWRLRIAAKEEQIKQNSTLSEDSILFFAQQNEPYYAEEIDAIWVSLKLSIPTLNGYDGFLPKYFTEEYGQDCSELPSRILSYLIFTNQPDNQQLYKTLMNRVVPIGFKNCNAQWWNEIPKYHFTNLNENNDRIFQKIVTRFSIDPNSQLAKTSMWVVTFLDKIGLEKKQAKWIINIES